MTIEAELRVAPREWPHGAVKDFAALAKVMARGAGSLALTGAPAQRKTSKRPLLVVTQLYELIGPNVCLITVK